MSQYYQHLFTGSSIDVLAIRDALESEHHARGKRRVRIGPLAGFGSPALQIQRGVCSQDEHEKAKGIGSNTRTTLFRSHLFYSFS